MFLFNKKMMSVWVLQIISIKLNDEIIDFSKKKLVLLPCNLIQFHSSYTYSVFDEYNRRSSDTGLLQLKG